MRQEVLHALVSIPDDAAQQRRGYVPAGMHRYRRPATIGMGELLVRPPVPNLDEAEPKQSRTTSRGLRTGRRDTRAQAVIV